METQEERTEKIIGRCGVRGLELTEKTLYVGDRELLCPFHAKGGSPQPAEPEITLFYRCTDCGEEIPEGEEWGDDDGLLCQYCGRRRRIKRESEDCEINDSGVGDFTGRRGGVDAVFHPLLATRMCFDPDERNFWILAHGVSQPGREGMFEWY